MPVRIGRVSSREAERATRAIVSVKAGAGMVDDLVAAGLGQRREVLGAQRADVEARGAGDDLDVLLGGPQLERHVAAGQLADDVEQQARGEDDRARRARPGASSGTRRPTSMSVARSSHGRPRRAICTPESACTALRVDATRETVCSWASSSCDEVDSFTMTTSG